MATGDESTERLGEETADNRSSDHTALQRSSSRELWQKIFFGSELRAGWRLLIFSALVIALFEVFRILVRVLYHPGRGVKVTEISPGLVIVQDSVFFAVTIAATFIMSRIEKRRMGTYGLPLRRSSLRNFGWGLFWGFTSLSALLAVFWLAGDFHITSLALHGSETIVYPIVWAFAFLLVGLAEEYLFRGYAQFTLSSGIGFWPAALALSLLFAWAHRSNQGEQLLGLAQVLAVALFLCFTLWRTGTLWFAVGWHAAWDWSQTCLYGTSDSGMPGAHHFFNSSLSGSRWFSGGTVGPEGSILCIPLDLLMIGLFFFIFPTQKYRET